MAVRVLLIAALLLAIYAASRMLVSGDRQDAETSPAPTAREAPVSEPSAAATPATPAREPGELVLEAEAGHGHEGASAEEQAHDLVAWLNENPLSESPHQVLRAWGGRPGKATRPVGLTIVVNQHLPTPALERLARDVRERYQEAPIFSTEIFDSEEAASYDRHSDGGALAARHLVARVVRDESLGVDSLRVRGYSLEP